MGSKMCSLRRPSAHNMGSNMGSTGVYAGGAYDGSKHQHVVHEVAAGRVAEVRSDIDLRGVSKPQ